MGEARIAAVVVGVWSFACAGRLTGLVLRADGTDPPFDNQSSISPIWCSIRRQQRQLQSVIDGTEVCILFRAQLPQNSSSNHR